MPERTDHNEAMRQHERDSRELRELCAQRDAARATVRQQAERIAELEKLVEDRRIETNRVIAIADKATTERDQLRAEVEMLRVDAERYQWLREHSYVEVTCKSSRDPSWTPQHLDTAIDIARKEAT